FKRQEAARRRPLSIRSGWRGLPPHASSSGRGFLALGLLRHRARILALGLGIAVDQLDHRHLGRIAVAEPGLDDPAIAAGPLLVALCEGREELLGDRGILKRRQGLAPRVKPAALPERDEPLHDRPQVLCLGQGRGDLLMLQERMRHVAEHGLSVRGGAAELPAAVAVTHFPYSLSAAQYGSSRRLASSSIFSGGQFGISMPRWSPIWAR